MDIYKKVLLLVTLLLIPVFSVTADSPISGAISSDTTWSPAGEVYIIDSSFSVAIGVTLTLEPGTIVKARATGMGGPSIYGNLVVNGTVEEPVYFTSIYDDSIGGDTDHGGPSVSQAGEWQGLYFKEGSTGDLDHVVVRYSGYGGYGFGNFVGIENDGGTLEMNNSNIHDNYRITSNGAGGVMTLGTGIYNKRGTLSVGDSIVSSNMYGIGVDSGTTTISNTVFENNRDNTGHNAGYGISARGEGPLVLINNAFAGNQKTAGIDVSKEFIHSGNISSDRERGFQIGGQIVRDTTLNSNDLPILINGGILVPAGMVLTIEPGTVIKLGDVWGNGSFSVNGSLVAKGTKDAKIYFTSRKDDSVGGDSNGDGDASIPGPRNWNAIFLEAGSTADFDNVVLRYAGFNYNGEYLSGIAAAVYQRGAEFLVSNSLFEHNRSMAIYQDAGITSIDHSEFRNQPYGIWSRGGDISISQSSLHNNTDLAVYNQSGPLIDARNNWWGSADGPRPVGSGDRVSENVLYNPWLGSDPLVGPTRNPVIIVPGIMSTELLDEDIIGLNKLIWPDTFKITLNLFDDFLDVLKMNNNGLPINNIVHGGVIRELNGNNYFDGIINYLIQLGYKENIDLFVFPYDWRLDINSSAQNLESKIDNIRNGGKVNVIAHSMGGLLMKEYLKQNGGNYIDKFVDIGTPHSGSPNSFKTIMYGDNLGVNYFFNWIGINSERIKIISQNMPSIYQLLPTREYFDLYPSYVSDLDDIDDNGVRGNLSYDDTKELMGKTGRNPLLLDRADEFHAGIANLNPASYGVKTYNIVGCGVQTLGRIFMLNKETSGSVEYNISYINGDGTVPLKSAEHIPAIKTYYAKNAVHATMPSLTGVKALVASILSGYEDLDISLYPNIAESANGCTVPNGKIVSFHSPIELHIYSGNKHVGPNADGDIEMNIPGVSYDVIDGNKFAFLPEGIEYTVKGVATADGTFNARIETIENEVVIETRYFNQVPITPTTQVELKDVSILIDNNSDTIFESEYPVSSVLDENESLDVTKPVTSVNVLGKRKRDEPYTAPVKVILSATDDNSGVLKTEYSVNNGQNWTTYLDPFTVSTKGITNLLYKSTDRAGNVEAFQFIDIEISKKIR